MTAEPLRLQLPRCLLDPGLPGVPADADGLVALAVEHREGRITRIRPTPAAGRRLPLAFTPLVEPHAHLDKCFSWPAFPNRSGTLAEALSQNLREAEHRTGEQVLERGAAALEKAWRHGLRAIRSHIDSGGPTARVSWEALLSLRQRWAGRVDLQLVALVPVSHWGTPAGAELAGWVADQGGLLGGVLGPPYGHGHRDRQSLARLLTLAERLGVGIDLHIDEADRNPARGLRLLLSLLQHRRPPVPITCSHVASLALLSERALQPLAEALAAAGVAVVALPLTNLWLLGRRSGQTPVLRPQAPLRSLQRAGVAVAVGGDNVQDPWYPGGDLDPLELLRLAPLTSQLWPAQRRDLAAFTTAPARLLDLSWDGVLREGGPADLVVTGADGWSDLLARSPRRRVLRGGRWLPWPDPQQTCALPEVSMG
jgi:cytosine deaminase